MVLAGWAAELAGALLAEPLPRRWAHTQGVAAQARAIAPILGRDADLLEAAAWLHDVGYAPALAATGFHPLDGARYLRDVAGADGRVCNLVAHHTFAELEAELRELDGVLGAEFGREPAELANALTYCDMTTGPDGARVTVDDRIDEITVRYGDDHVVARFIRSATADIRATIDQVGQLLRAYQVGNPAHP